MTTDWVPALSSVARDNRATTQFRELPSVIVTKVTMIHHISQRRFHSSQFSGTVIRCVGAFINLLWSNVTSTIARTLRFTFLKYVLPAIHLTIRRINVVHFIRLANSVFPSFFAARRIVTIFSFLFSFVQHILFCSNLPLGLMKNFLQNCLRFPWGMFRQTICDVISGINPS